MITTLGPMGVSRTPSGPYFASSSNPGGGGGGLPAAGDRDDFRIEYADALNEDDAMGGMVVSGFWFPAHMLKEVDGRVYGVPMAPEPRKNPRIT